MGSGVVSAVGTRVGIVVLYLLASVAGRATVVASDAHALVWPAGGVAVAWLITRRSLREWAVDIPLVVVAASALTLLTGRGVVITAVLAMSNLTAVLTTAVAVRWWTRDTTRRGAATYESTRALVAFLTAVVVGSLAGVAVGAAGLLLAGHDVSGAGLAVWFGRNVCGVAAVGVTMLLIIDRVRHGRRTSTPTGRWPELVLLFVATAALIVTDFATVLPVSLLLPAAAVWAGSRFSSLAAAVHALVGGAGFLALTYYGQGPFAMVPSERTSIMLAQLFIAMTLVIGLLLAAARETRTTLLGQLLAREREQNQELMTFARRAAHDLRNPLSVIETWTTELSDSLSAVPGGPPPGTPTMIAGIERASARMRSLVDALLADAAAHDRSPDRHQVDLPALVDEVAREYGAAGRVRTLGVRTVAGDPVLLRQLVDNLLGNALKYVAPGRPPDITVTAHRTADRVVVRVIDNGIGIPPGAHEWIFEPFRRAHEDAYPGTGLGLSTCRRIVERHGGSLRAAPREDGPGSVFEFDLPYTPTSV